jgi:hypothetical protein
MGVFIYRIKADELDERFIEALKTLFKGREISISVQPAKGAAKQSVWDLIERNDKSAHTYQFTAEEFSTIVAESAANENYNLEAAFERHKVLKTNAETTD